MAVVAFSYDPETPVGRVRLLAAETDPSGLDAAGGDRTRTDAEIEALLAINDGDERLAAACIVEGKAAEFAAGSVTITQGALRQDFRDRSQRMLEVAKALRDGRAATPSFAASPAPAAFGVVQPLDPAEV